MNLSYKLLLCTLFKKIDLLYTFLFNFKVKTQLFKYKIIIIVVSNYGLLF